MMRMLVLVSLCGWAVAQLPTPVSQWGPQWSTAACTGPTVAATCADLANFTSVTSCSRSVQCPWHPFLSLLPRIHTGSSWAVLLAHSNVGVGGADLCSQHRQTQTGTFGHRQQGPSTSSAFPLGCLCKCSRTISLFRYRTNNNTPSLLLLSPLPSLSIPLPLEPSAALCLSSCSIS
jgi:hypothetical protein